jgi:hypothetical protein
MCSSKGNGRLKMENNRAETAKMFFLRPLADVSLRE